MKRLVCAIYGDGHPFNGWNMFNAYDVAQDPEDLVEGDVLVVWGGGDISPTLYNKPLSMFGGGERDRPSRRDAVEWALMQRAKELGCPIIGVCRGGQMITALEGGHLIQHISNHLGHHHIVTNDEKILHVNSIHHQMMVPPPNGKFEVIATVPKPLSDVYWDVVEGKDVQVEVEAEPEFIYYPEIKGFAIQWHPEGMTYMSPANLYLKQFIGDRI